MCLPPRIVPSFCFSLPYVSSRNAPLQEVLLEAALRDDTKNSCGPKRNPRQCLCKMLGSKRGGIIIRDEQMTNEFQTMWCYPGGLFLSNVDLSMCVCMRNWCQDKRQIPLGSSRHSSIFIQKRRVKHAGKCAYAINARKQCAGIIKFPAKMFILCSPAGQHGDHCRRGEIFFIFPLLSFAGSLYEWLLIIWCSRSKSVL